MRRFHRPLLLLLALTSCGPGPTIVTSPPPPSFGESGGTEGPTGPRTVQAVAVRWEEQPAVVEDPFAAKALASAPMSLTSPDGVGLEIASLEVAAAVQDPLAFTEMHFVFKNPAARAIEGRFEIVLPPGATISRFAMKNADGWKEGEVVEQEAARVAYEDFLHRRADPALLEKQAGNRFQARVFPIPASGEKEIIVSYSQALASRAAPYRVHLRGLPRLGRFDLRVIEQARKSATKVHGFQKSDFVPDRDFVLPLGQDGAASPGLRHEELAVARVTPMAEDKPEPVRDLLVLLDTSASRALDLEVQAKRLGAILAALPDGGDDMPIAVACFDQGLEPIYIGPKKGFSAREIEAIVRRKALGASDLGLALESAAAYAQKQGGKFTRALILTDGIPTAGPDDAKDIAEPLRKLRDAGIRRLDAIAAGGIRDEALLARLTTGILPQGGVVLDAAKSPSELAARLGRATASGLSVSVPGARWFYPEKLDSIQPGDEALIYAELPKGAPFEVEIGGPAGKVKRAVTFDFAERPLIERAMAKAQIERLGRKRDDAEKPEERAALAKEIVSISTRFRVLSDFTSLLVLDTEEDYARFGIDRRALADILVVGKAGVELLHRTGGPAAVAANEPEEDAPAKSPSTGDLKGAAGEKKKDSASGGEGQRAETTVPAAEAPPPPPPAQALSRDQLKEEAKPEPPGDFGPSGGAAAPTATAAGQGFGSGHGRLGGAPAAAPRPRTSRQFDVADPWSDGDERPRPSRRPPWRPPPQPQPEEENDDDSEQNRVDPFEGKFADVMHLLQAKRPGDALSLASSWRESDPGDALALVALGDAFEALGDKAQAARASGSIIDLFPGRADLRRFAGARLERLGKGMDATSWLVVDTFKKAVASRPDHPSGHRMLAYALLRAGKHEEALEAILAGFVRPYPSGRFAGVRRVLADDVGILAAALVKAHPEQRAAVEKRLAELGVKMATKPSLRFVLTWETDANDVDFHIRDGKKGHAYYARPRLRSGGELYADVTTGYGPECFTIEGRALSYPYKLAAHYYSKGPMGYGMGKLEIVEHDGAGGIKLEERPFVVMTDRAFVDLGVVNGPLKGL